MQYFPLNIKWHIIFFLHLKIWKFLFKLQLIFQPLLMKFFNPKLNKYQYSILCFPLRLVSPQTFYFPKRSQHSSQRYNFSKRFIITGNPILKTMLKTTFKTELKSATEADPFRKSPIEKILRNGRERLGNDIQLDEYHLRFGSLRSCEWSRLDHFFPSSLLVKKVYRALGSTVDKVARTVLTYWWKLQSSCWLPALQAKIFLDFDLCVCEFSQTFSLGFGLRDKHYRFVYFIIYIFLYFFYLWIFIHSIEYFSSYFNIYFDFNIFQFYYVDLISIFWFSFNIFFLIFNICFRFYQFFIKIWLYKY